MSSITVMGDYLNDPIGRYFASRVLQYKKDIYTGIPYEIAITTTKTSKESIDYWIEVMTGNLPLEPSETDVEAAMYASLFQRNTSAANREEP